MQVFIHVGLHKTGTTFLQRFVFPEIREANFASIPKWHGLLKESFSNEEQHAKILDTKFRFFVSTPI